MNQREDASAATAEGSTQEDDAHELGCWVCPLCGQTTIYSDELPSSYPFQKCLSTECLLVTLRKK